MAVAREVNQLKIGSLLSYVQMGLGAVVSLAFTPVMLRLLGRSEYGLYSTVTSAISMLSLLDLGFSSGYIRFYAQYREKGDRNGIARLNGFFLLLFSGLGLVALGCGLFLTSHAELVFSRGLTAEEYATARRLLTILSVNLSCMFPMRVFGNIISAKERFVFLRAVHLGRTVLSPLVMLPLLLMGYRSAAMVWVTLLFSLGTDLLFAWYVLRVLGEKFVFRGFERGAVRSLLLYTSFIAVNLIADQVNWNVDKVLLGRFRGTGEVAVYAVGYTLFQYYMMLSTSVSSVFTPRIHRIIRQTETDTAARRQALTELFTRVGRVQLLLLGLAATGVAFFGRAFILRWWAGPEYGGAYPVALILMLSATVDLIQNTGIEMQRAQNLHGFRSLVYGAMAVGNLVLSVFLCRRYGALGAVAGTAASMLLANGLAMNLYYHRRCGVDVLHFWRSVGRLCRGMMIPVFCGGALGWLVRDAGLGAYLGAIAIYTAIYGASMWHFGMDAYEKELFAGPVRRLWARKPIQ